MSTETPERAAAGAEMARWSAKALLITAGVFLVGGAVWYARAATVPLIVAALIATQLIPLVEIMVRRGLPRGAAVAAGMLVVVAIGCGIAWLFLDSLFGNLGSLGDDISEGADDVVAWLQANNDWIQQHEEQIRQFLKGILPAAKTAADGLLTGALGGLSFAAQVIRQKLPSSPILEICDLKQCVDNPDYVLHTANPEDLMAMVETIFHP